LRIFKGSTFYLTVFRIRYDNLACSFVEGNSMNWLKSVLRTKVVPVGRGKHLPIASFQTRVTAWVLETFGKDIANHDRDGRSGLSEDARFMEEALELFQALGNTPEHLWLLAQDVYAKPAGDPCQELGGVQTTLAALASAHGFDMVEAREVELARMWTQCAAIRAKSAGKPMYESPGNQPRRRGNLENNWKPSVEQIESACYNYRHDFGLLSKEEQDQVRLSARYWLEAWLKEMPSTPVLRQPPVAANDLVKAKYQSVG
jgi:hypothetical protein